MRLEKEKKKKLALTGCVLYATSHTKCCEKLLPAPFQRREKMGFQNVNTSVKITQPAKVGCNLELCSLVTGLCPAEFCHPRPSVLEPQAPLLSKAVWTQKDSTQRGCGPLRSAAMPDGPGRDVGQQTQAAPTPRALIGLQAANSVYLGLCLRQDPFNIHQTLCPAWPKEQQGGVQKKEETEPWVMLDPRAMGICTPAVYQAQHLSCWAACTPRPARGSWSWGAGSSRVEAPQQL